MDIVKRMNHIRWFASGHSVLSLSPLLFWSTSRKQLFLFYINNLLTMSDSKSCDYSMHTQKKAPNRMYLSALNLSNCATCEKVPTLTFMCENSLFVSLLHSHWRVDLHESLWAVLFGHPLPLDVCRYGKSTSGAAQSRAAAVQVHINVHCHLLLYDTRRNCKGRSRVISTTGSRKWM